MSLFTDNELALITTDLNIRRYLNGDKIDVFKVGQMATTTYPNGYDHGPRTHNESISLNTIDRPIVKVKEGEIMRIRKLVPCECVKLMSFTREDYQALRDIGQTDAQIYHEMGDSICVNVLVAIIGALLPISDEKLQQGIRDYIEEIKES